MAIAIFCQACEDEYIVEMGRTLYVRVKNTKSGNLKLNQMLLTHEGHRDYGEDSEVEFVILVQKSETSARKIIEAFWINSGNVEMNRREKCLAISRDPTQCLRLIF